jgi:hypothetical protein
MKMIWIKWCGGIETRDDGYTIYHDPRWAILRCPDGTLQKYPTAEAAKRAVEEGTVLADSVKEVLNKGVLTNSL